MRILVTGASGLLGLAVAIEAAPGHEVIGLANRHRIASKVQQSGSLGFLPRFRVAEADLLAEAAVPTLVHETCPDWIIHCAALALVDDCEENPEVARQLNADVPRQLAEATASAGIRLLHVSTDAVFDGRLGGYAENDPPNPLSVYARTKLEGELAVREANPQAAIARVCFHGWSRSGDRSISEFFFNNLVVNRPVPGFTDVRFSPLMANDLARLLLRMLENNLSGIYHVASADSCSKYNFGVLLAKRFDFDTALVIPKKLTDSGLHAPRPLNLSLDTRKLSSALGESLPSVSKGLDHLYSLHRTGYRDAVLRI